MQFRLEVAPGDDRTDVLEAVRIAAKKTHVNVVYTFNEMQYGWLWSRQPGQNEQLAHYQYDNGIGWSKIL